MNNREYKPLLSEALRPQNASELIVCPSVQKIIDRFISDRSIMNVTFYGTPGTGKTSAARLILKEIDADVYRLSGSLSVSDKAAVRNIEVFANVYSFFEQRKVVFIDEADMLSKDVQQALRYVIENTSHNCRFLFTANDISKLSDALKSRCMPVRFDIPPSKINEIQVEAVRKYEKKLSSIDCHIDDEVLREVIQTHFPDFRSIANHLEPYASY